jgi:hypothetical protein
MHVPLTLRRASILVGGAALLLAPLSVPSAGAAGTTMGGVFAPDITCSNTINDSTILQSASPAGAYTVPDDGVITSWSFTVGAASPTTVAFRLGRSSAAPSGFEIVGAGPRVPVFGQSVVNEPLRVPARRGDRLGLYVGSPTSGTAACVRTVTGYSAVFGVGDVTSGPLAGSLQSDLQVDVAATLEPDADHDGYGDLSQDLCSYDPSTQKACAAPDTSITSRKVAKSGKKVVITFASSKPSSTFECALGSPVYRPCTSPFTVKTKSGKQVFGVRAVDAAGVADRSAATVTVKPKKHRKP